MQDKFEGFEQVEILQLECGDYRFAGRKMALQKSAGAKGGLWLTIIHEKCDAQQVRFYVSKRHMARIRKWLERQERRAGA